MSKSNTFISPSGGLFVKRQVFIFVFRSLQLFNMIQKRLVNMNIESQLIHIYYSSHKLLLNYSYAQIDHKLMLKVHGGKAICI